MQLFITLLIAHLFADFPLQTNLLAAWKEKHWLGIVPHVLIHMGITALLLNNGQRYWPLVVLLGIAHFGIDLLKLLYPGKKGIGYFLLDQMLHFATLLLAAFMAERAWNPAPVGIFPDEWLPLILFSASIPAFMVLSWVWINSLNQEYIRRVYVLSWSKQELLLLEQRIGLTIIGIVFLQVAIYYWSGIVAFGL
jgi:Protein of unknown function (DUF3307)